MQTLDQICINTVRFLAVDCRGGSSLRTYGAPRGYVHWDRFLRHNPRDPKWPNRDRFLRSCRPEILHNLNSLNSNKSLMRWMLTSEGR
jgi:hypothetical protein